MTTPNRIAVLEALAAGGTVPIDPASAELREVLWGMLQDDLLIVLPEISNYKLSQKGRDAALMVLAQRVAA